MTNPTKKNQEEIEKKEKLEKYNNYCKEIEAKLRKAEKHSWLKKDLDYTQQ